MGYFELQKQVHELETMPNTAIRPARWDRQSDTTTTTLYYNIISTFLIALFRFNADEFLSIEELPAPKKVQPKEPEPERPKPAVSRQVGIADQIAIRSYVLGKGAKTSE